jgi:hypothetical protein
MRKLLYIRGGVIALPFSGFIGSTSDHRHERDHADTANAVESTSKIRYQLERTSCGLLD